LWVRTTHFQNPPPALLPVFNPMLRILAGVNCSFNSVEVIQHLLQYHLEFWHSNCPPEIEKTIGMV
jgi:hypothetical protein